MFSLRGQRQQAQLLPLHSALAFPRGWLWKQPPPQAHGDMCVSRCCSAEVCCPAGSLPSPVLVPRALWFMLWNPCFPSWPSCSQTLWSWTLNGAV